MLPPLIYLCIWKFGPFFYTLGLSFSSFNLVYDKYPTFVGLRNYLEVIKDINFVQVLIRTFLFMIVAVLLQLILGLGLAIFFDGKLLIKEKLKTLIILPMITAPVVVGLIWYILYSDNIGPINYLLSTIGLPRISWLSNPSTALYSIIIADVWQWTPFTFLLLLTGLQNIPPEVIEAAKIDGCSSLKMFRYITLPMIRITILTTVILRSLDAFVELPKIYVMTGGGPGGNTEIISLLVYKTVFRSYRLGYGATMVIIALAITSGLYGIYLWVNNHYGRTE